jgi:hypothetical protein
MDPPELHIGPHSPATLAVTTDGTAEGVKLAPNSRTLGVELINRRVTLPKLMLLAQHR